MQFETNKFGVVFREIGKVIRTDSIRHPDGKDMEDIDHAGCTYLGILETDKVKEKKLKKSLARSICDD